MTKLTHCPLCHTQLEDPFHTAPGVPVHQNLLYDTPASARTCRRGDLELCLCPHCGFVSNRAFDASLLSYSSAYENTQSHSGSFRDYLDHLCTRLINNFHLHGKTLVEVGCGNGDFLRLLCQRGGNRGHGFDPSYTGPAEEPAVGLGVSFVTDVYGPAYADIPADFILSKHVIEHLGDPLAMLKQVHQAAGHRRDAVIYFETPELHWILQHNAFWDFFYEHCSYFTLDSLRFAFERAGFEVLESAPAFEGQYQFLLARPLAMPPSHPAPPVSPKGALSAFCHHFQDHKNAVGDFLHRYAPAEVAVWGAGAKGVTLLNLFDPGGTHFPHLVDINPRKQGYFAAGTGHPIVAPDVLRGAPPKLVLVMNQNYLEEIRHTVAGLGLDADVTAIEQLPV